MAEFDLDVDIEDMKVQFREQSEQATAAGEEFFAKLKRLREDDAKEESAS